MKFETVWPSLIWPYLRIDERVIVNKARKVGWGQSVHVKKPGVPNTQLKKASQLPFKPSL